MESISSIISRFVMAAILGPHLMGKAYCIIHRSFIGGGLDKTLERGKSPPMKRVLGSSYGLVAMASQRPMAYTNWLTTHAELKLAPWAEAVEFQRQLLAHRAFRVL